MQVCVWAYLVFWAKKYWSYDRTRSSRTWLICIYTIYVFIFNDVDTLLAYQLIVPDPPKPDLEANCKYLYCHSLK
jgi:hypothetical protein